MLHDRPAHPLTRRLGELLVERGALKREQLEQALKEQRASREFLGIILLRMGFISPETLIQALSEQFNIPRESLTVERVDWGVVKQFPRSALAGEKCFPIRADAESVTVAVANPLDAWAISAIEKVAGYRKVKAVLVLEDELQQILRHYRQQVLQTIIQERLTNDHKIGE